MTPGPWELRDFGHRERGGVYVVGTRGEWGCPTVCEMPMQPNGEPCTDALDDGRLISAAPQLLAALKMVRSGTPCGPTCAGGWEKCTGCDWIVKEAIRKAEDRA